MKPFSENRRRLVLSGLSGIAFSSLAVRARAQDYPAKPVTFLCPWPPGGTADSTMRVLCAEAAKVLGRPIVFENRAGAAGMIGTAALLAARPDGYTIGQIPLSVTRFSQLGTLKYDPLRDISFIARANGQTFGIAALSESKWKSLKELVAHAKENPGKVTYSHSGVAGQTHVGMEEFAMKAGIQLNNIPYKGGSEALQALLGGHVDLLADSSSWAPLVESGRLRLLATWGEKRVPRFSSTPTLKESGYDVVVEAPNGIGAPRGLEPQVHAKLREAFRQAVLSAEFKKACDRIDSAVMYQDADDYRRYVEASYAHETELIRRLKLKDLT